MASEPSASGLMSGESENGAGIALCGFPLRGVAQYSLFESLVVLLA